MAKGSFRQDLYHRLKVVSVKLPRSAHRREDIPLLIEHFLKQFTASHEKTVTSITPAVRKILMAYDWPGNVRELKNAIESMVVMDIDGVLDIDDLIEDLQPGAGEAGHGSRQPRRPEARRHRALLHPRNPQNQRRQPRGNRQALGIGERTLYRKLDEYRKQGLTGL